MVKKIIATGAAALLLLGLTGCGDDSVTPIVKNEISQVDKSKSAVDDLNKLTEESESIIDEFD